jgi:hypothetical protein
VQCAETAGKGPADRAEWNLLKANIFEVNWLLAAKGGNVASSFLFHCVKNLLGRPLLTPSIYHTRAGIKAALSLVDLDPTFAKNEHHSALTVTVKGATHL